MKESLVSLVLTVGILIMSIRLLGCSTYSRGAFAMNERVPGAGQVVSSRLEVELADRPTAGNPVIRLKVNEIDLRKYNAVRKYKQMKTVSKVGQTFLFGPRQSAAF